MQKDAFSRIRAAYWLGLASLVGVAGCSGGSVVPSPNAAAAPPALPAAAKSCTVTKKLSSAGGFISFPKCFGFSGKIAYPYSPASAGTITARLTVSVTDPGVYEKVPKAIYYTTWVFTSSNKSETTIGFYHTYIGAHNGCKLQGSAVKPSAKYYGLFEVPNSYHPIKQTKIGISVGGTTQGHSILGIPFVGTPVLAGVKNYVVFSPHDT
ncbi:MAG TPA: hypothetical protein VMF61_03890 [Candidatus Acidoferrales bacterium]|nr:hypothetical protein [Candidatus Acidoferrales bacterium]